MNDDERDDVTSTPLGTPGDPGLTSEAHPPSDDVTAAVVMENVLHDKYGDAPTTGTRRIPSVSPFVLGMASVVGLTALRLVLGPLRPAVGSDTALDLTGDSAASPVTDVLSRQLRTRLARREARLQTIEARVAELAEQTRASRNTSAWPLALLVGGGYLVWRNPQMQDRLRQLVQTPGGADGGAGADRPSSAGSGTQPYEERVAELTRDGDELSSDLKDRRNHKL